MRVDEFEDAKSFLSAVEPFLIDHEAENCLVLGIANSLVVRPTEDDVFLSAVVDEGGRPVGAAIRTPPRDLILSYGIPSEAIEVVVQYGAERSHDLPGVLGEKGPTDDFATAWSERQRVTANLFRAERIHKATEVTQPVGVEGEARPVTDEKRETFEEWIAGFGRHVGEVIEPDQVTEMADVYLSGPPYQAFMWWREDRPVSMAVLGGPTPNGARINAVYTPPEFRGHGYASGVTAALTHHALALGRQFCCLFTDLANPISNRIYHRIGYRPVCDVSHYRFLSSHRSGVPPRDPCGAQRTR